MTVGGCEAVVDDTKYMLTTCATKVELCIAEP